MQLISEAMTAGMLEALAERERDTMRVVGPHNMQNPAGNRKQRRAAEALARRAKHRNPDKETEA